MTRILQLNTSIHGDNGASSTLADNFVHQWQDRHGKSAVIRRDFSKSPIPHLDADTFSAAISPVGTRSRNQQTSAALADTLIQELLGADVLVIGLPMYNFGVPSSLKAWFDHVARAGTTFRYTADGPVPLLTNKRAYVFATRGGWYAGTERDTQAAYVKQFLSFLGIDNIEFVYAEGLSISEENRRTAVESATAHLAKLAA